MDSLTSRQVAIDEWKNDFKGYVNELYIPRDDYNGIMAYIDEVPSAQPEQRWIPVTERKPQRRSYVVVTDCDGVEEAYYSSDGTWFDTLGDKLKDVTAWMPLPESYRGE